MASITETRPVTPQAETPDDVIPLGHDDYSLTRVPDGARYGWLSVAMQRFGQLSALAQFFLAASIGIGMDFWPAMAAILVGSVLLEIVTIFVGISGQREGLNTSLLSRWTGFGMIGSALVGVVVALSLVGWFGVQNEVFADGLHRIFDGVPKWIFAVLGGVVVTLVVIYGFKWMNWVAWVAVPSFLLLCLYSISVEMGRHTLSEAMTHHGVTISFATATTIVAGGFITGAIFTPDMSRFNRTPVDVVKQTIVGVTLGEFFVGVIGVMLAHMIKLTDPKDAGNVIGIIQGTSGVLGVLVLCVSIIKINDWNLYPSSLGIVNSMRGLFGVRLNRVVVAIVLGMLGTLLSAVGFASKFQEFLTEVGVLFPPIAAIMIADYFVLKTWRPDLDRSRNDGFTLPATVPTIVPAGLIAWAVGYAFGKFSTENPDFLQGINVPAISSLIVTFVVYVAIGKLAPASWTRGIGIKDTSEAAL